jgi:hypothetical protein
LWGEWKIESWPYTSFVKWVPIELVEDVMQFLTCSFFSNNNRFINEFSDYITNV